MLSNSSCEPSIFRLPKSICRSCSRPQRSIKSGLPCPPETLVDRSRAVIKPLPVKKASTRVRRSTPECGLQIAIKVGGHVENLQKQIYLALVSAIEKYRSRPANSFWLANNQTYRISVSTSRKHRDEDVVGVIKRKQVRKGFRESRDRQ